MPRTKEKILEVSLALFNENGLKNTTLQIIADHVDISVGNLAYHYKNKQEIIATHTIHLESALQNVLAHYRNYPNFLDFHIQLNQILEVQDQYKFVFTNPGEIKSVYQDTFKLIQSFYNKLRTQIEARLEYHQNKGLMNFPDSEIIQTLPDNIASLIIHANSSALLRQTEDSASLKVEVWNLFKPFLSPQGLHEWNLIIHPVIYS